MTTRFVVPTLAALAFIPAAHAFDIAGDGWELSIEPRIQTRIEFASASDAAGDDYDIWEGSSTENPQQMNFQVRRARIYFKGKSDTGWKFNYTIYADEIGLQDDRDGAGLEVRYANVGKEIKSGDMKHYVQFGLDKHTSSVADTDSSSKSLFPNGRLAAAFAGPRSIGLDYKLSASAFSVKAGLADEDGDDNNDWLFYARVATPIMTDWKLNKRSESYLGKEGQGHELGIGFDIKIDGSDATDGTEDDGYTVFNIDYLLHMDAITALADISLIDRDEASTKGGGTGDTGGIIVSLQAGYAIPLEDGTVAEPAIRLAMIDADDDNDDETGVLTEEGGDSGTYIDLGINYYLDGHSNKFQAGIQIFSPEEGDGDAVAFRLAHQIDF